MQVVPLYAAILGLLFVALSVRTIRVRRRFRVGVGDGGNPALLRAMRVHSNFAEYVPIALILLALVEMGGASPLMIHGLGACLVAGRVSHAFGVSHDKENYRFRVAGMALTFFVLVAASITLLVAAVARR
jgi:uncharacterized membrane protein YecN with MAPEG domain